MDICMYGQDNQLSCRIPLAFWKLSKITSRQVEESSSGLLANLQSLLYNTADEKYYENFLYRIQSFVL